MRSRPMPVRFASSSSSTPPNETDYKLRLATALVGNGSTVLKELLELQNKGWNDESTELHFQKQRYTADNASSDQNRMWFQRMRGLIREVDANLKIVPVGEMEFLDLGCCPGGFSSYILGRNANANGTGVSLPVDDGGYELSLEDRHLFRFNFFFANLTNYQLGPTIIDDPKLQGLPSEIKLHSFDLVLLGGNQLRTQLSALPWDGDRLFISQLILGIQSVKEGGTILMKLPMPHKPITARILYLFNMISTRLLRWKPTKMHANRGTFYAVAKGVGNDGKAAKIPAILAGLKDLWMSLTFGGDDGQGRFMSPDDLDFLVSMDDLVEHHLDWLTKLGTPLWKVQLEALKRLYEEKASH